eukprot:Skav203875  [mRNA]  locus=scaffold1031:183971:188117:- [translate_table: standard]
MQRHSVQSVPFGRFGQCGLMPNWGTEHMVYKLTTKTLPEKEFRDRKAADAPNPPLTDPDVANHYLGLFMRKKLVRPPVAQGAVQGDKSSHYFEVGMKLAFLMKNPKLQEILMNAYTSRYRDILVLSSSLGEVNRSIRKAVPSQFLQSLTSIEEDIYRGACEAEAQYTSWYQSFSSYVREASHIAEVPAFKRARLGA